MAKSILIVEDDESLFNLYRTALELKDYEVLHVADGNLGFQTAKENMPDLVLLDLMLPNKTGLEILDEIKGDSATAELRVLMLTNFGNEDNVSRALEAGAEDYIMKYNIVPSELAEKVATLLGDQEDSAVKFMS